jgi:hypothetical protein
MACGHCFLPLMVSLQEHSLVDLGSYQGAWHMVDTQWSFVYESCKSQSIREQEKCAATTQCLRATCIVTTLQVTRLTCKSQSFVQNLGVW